MPIRQTSAVDFGVSDVKSTRLLICRRYSSIVERPVIWTVDSAGGPASDAYDLKKQKKKELLIL